MHLPLFFHSDASFRYGNNTANEMLEKAKDCGYQRTCIIDVSSTCGVIKYLSSSTKLNIQSMVGATIPVSIKKRDEFKWAIDNQNFIKWLFQTLGSPIPPIGDAYRFTKSLSDTLLKYSKSTAEERDKVLFASLTSIFGKTNFDFTSAQRNQALWKRVCGKTDFSLRPGHLTFVSKTREGYQNILKLVSMLAKKKHDSIALNGVASSEIYSVDRNDINRFCKDVLVLDSYDKDSVLGLLRHPTFKGRVGHFAKAIFDNELFINCIGLQPVHCQTDADDIVSVSSLFNIKIVPYPKASYSCEALYDSFCVKVAVHTDQKIGNIGFDAPPRDECVLNHDKAIELIDALRVEGLDSGFWDTVSDSDVELNRIRLPNYDMKIREVVEYAFMQREKTYSFDSDSDAIEAFEQWIKVDLPENTPLSEFRQKRLNDYCLLMLSYNGLKLRLFEQFGEEADTHYKKYEDRLLHEFTVIESMGFSGYFLIEYDFVSYARRVGVPVGDGRGSAAGSLVVYCLEITDVDPIEYGLQFERFLNPERVSMPDIDVDFGEGGDYDRGSVLKYISEKYQQSGTDFPSSSQIANINRYQLKSSISAVRKAYGLSMRYDHYLKGVLKVAEQELGKGKELKWDDLKEIDLVQVLLKTKPMFRRIFEMAEKLTGKMSTYGVHAGGVVISPSIIPDYSAISCDDSGNYFSQFDKDDIETAGLIKFDVLGLTTLSVISETIQQIEKTRGFTLNPRTIDKRDPKVFELISEQILSDVFQLEGGGMRELVGNLQPQSIEEIAVLSALYRPGALDSGMVEEYIDVKYGKKVATYDHPALESVTRETFGCIVYQEQVMSIVRELAGYSLGEADLLRRAMGKKKNEEMQKQRSVYALRTQQFWQEHYYKVGEDLGFKFKLCLNLSDLESELTMLGVYEFLDDKGHITNLDNLVSLMARLFSYKESDIATLEQRLHDFKYTLRMFQQQYQTAFTSGLFGRVSIKFGEDKANEVCKRVYYAITQYVRFNQIFNKVEKFAGYGFNKSHAIAYSVISYLTAYLKTHYPAEFYSAALSFKSLDKISSTVSEATQKMGVKLLPPNINKSNVRFSVERHNCVRYGLEKLRSVSNISYAITGERSLNGPYLSIFDFVYRFIGKKPKPDVSAVTSLAVTGAFDELIPMRIKTNKNLNGRQFVLWYFCLLSKSTLCKKKEVISRLHTSIDKMTDPEFFIYLSVLTGVSTLTKDKILLNSIMQGTDFSDALALAKKKTSITSLNMLLISCPQSIEHRNGIFGELLREFESSGSITSFEIQFLTYYILFSKHEEFIANWERKLNSVLGVPVTETLNAERHASGMYMTSTPIRVLNIAERAEREPPSSIIDGCPVEVRVIDGSYDEQQVTTYGIVRNVEVKTVKKETSKWFNEKMMFFDLEQGADFVNCMIFGSKGVNVFSEKIITEGAVILLAGEVGLNDFGLTIQVKAIKRYYPVEDDKLLVVPKA